MFLTTSKEPTAPVQVRHTTVRPVLGDSRSFFAYIYIYILSLSTSYSHSLLTDAELRQYWDRRQDFETESAPAFYTFQRWPSQEENNTRFILDMPAHSNWYSQQTIMFTTHDPWKMAPSPAFLSIFWLSILRRLRRFWNIPQTGYHIEMFRRIEARMQSSHHSRYFWPSRRPCHLSLFMDNKTLEKRKQMNRPTQRIPLLRTFPSRLAGTNTTGSEYSERLCPRQAGRLAQHSARSFQDVE